MPRHPGAVWALRDGRWTSNAVHMDELRGHIHNDSEVQERWDVLQSYPIG